MTRPLILVTNDDGYRAKGLASLIQYLRPYGDIYCVCPEKQRSAQSMAMTINEPMHLTECPDWEGARTFTLTGTPVDCVKFSLLNVLPHRPDLVVAGINHGSNASVNVLYSGTMGAVREGCACGIPSIGFSLTDHNPDADFTPCRPFVEQIVEETLRNGLPEDVCLNVNIPDNTIPAEMRRVRECRGRWSDEYVKYTDPFGRPFYWLSGHFINLEPEATDTDLWCLDHGIVSVVPTPVFIKY